MISRKREENMPSLVGIVYDSLIWFNQGFDEREISVVISQSVDASPINSAMTVLERVRDKEGGELFSLTLSRGSGQALDVPPEPSELLGQLAAMMKTVAGDDDDCRAIRMHVGLSTRLQVRR